MFTLKVCPVREARCSILILPSWVMLTLFKAKIYIYESDDLNTFAASEKRTGNFILLCSVTSEIFETKVFRLANISKLLNCLIKYLGLSILIFIALECISSLNHTDCKPCHVCHPTL